MKDTDSIVTPPCPTTICTNRTTVTLPNLKNANKSCSPGGNPITRGIVVQKISSLNQFQAREKYSQFMNLWWRRLEAPPPPWNRQFVQTVKQWVLPVQPCTIAARRRSRIIEDNACSDENLIKEKEQEKEKEKKPPTYTHPRFYSHIFWFLHCFTTHRNQSFHIAFQPERLRCYCCSM